MIGVLKNTALTQEQKEYVETVESSGEALLDLVNDILDFSKIGTPLHLPRPIFLCGELRPSRYRRTFSCALFWLRDLGLPINADFLRFSFPFIFC
jgi:signal transduction histidine kinase